MNDIIFSEVVNVNSLGLTLKHNGSNILIRFDECAKNFANENSLKLSKCVATRDITKLTFTFYTNPKIKVVFKNSSLKDFLFGRSAVRQFSNLRNAISQYGYTTFDLS